MPVIRTPAIDAIVIIYTSLALRSCVSCALVVPCLALWILFSTSRSRRQPVFWIQLLAIILTVIYWSLNATLFLHATRERLSAIVRSTKSTTYRRIEESQYVVYWLIAPIIDTALIFRLMAFYPAQLVPLHRRIRVVAFPVLIKIPRLASILAILVYFFKKDETHEEMLWTRNCQLFEYLLQMVDNTYITVLLLLRIYRKFRAKGLQKVPSAFSKRATRLLLEASTVSFLPAVLVQMVLCGMKVYQLKRNRFLYFLYVEDGLYNLNVLVSLLCSLLATRWTVLRNTNAEMRITEILHRGLRYDETRLRQSRSSARVLSAEARESKIAPNRLGGAIIDESRRKPSVAYTLSSLDHPKAELGGGVDAARHLQWSAQNHPETDGDNCTLLHRLFDDDEVEVLADDYFVVDGEEATKESASGALSAETRVEQNVHEDG